MIAILADFAMNSAAFGLYFLASNFNGNLYRDIAVIQLITRFFRYFSTPIFIWIVLDVKKAFGEFHSVLERDELREQDIADDGISLSGHTKTWNSDLRYSSF